MKNTSLTTNFDSVRSQNSNFSRLILSKPFKKELTRVQGLIFHKPF